MVEIVNMKVFSVPFSFQVFLKLLVLWGHLKKQEIKNPEGHALLCVREQDFSMVQTLLIEWLFFVLVTIY